MKKEGRMRKCQMAGSEVKTRHDVQDGWVSRRNKEEVQPELS